MKKLLCAIIALLFLASFGVFAGGQTDKEGAVVEDNTLEVLHWWTSGGEAAALNVLKENLEGQGVEWIDMPVAGGGGTEAMTVVRSRATAGNPPAAVQMLGFNILDWAKLGVLANMNDLAAKENWDAVIPDALKGFSKYEGQWIAAPVNVHSTNWVWANKKICDELGIALPIMSWNDYIAALDKAKAAGYTALAHGGQAWQDATIFDGVMISAGGPQFYKKAVVDLDDATLRSSTMLETFRRISKLRTYMDANFSGRDWNLASSMVIEDKAVFQMMGDWAKGEFINAGKVDGVDFVAFRTPGSQGTVTFNSDQFVMFEVEESKRATQTMMASAVMSPEFQIAFNTVKGSVPARTDISDAKFTASGKKGMKDLAEAGKNGTLFGSLAHQHGAPVAIMEAMYDVITGHINGAYSDEEAVEALADAVAATK